MFLGSSRKHIAKTYTPIHFHNDTNQKTGTLRGSKLDPFLPLDAADTTTSVCDQEFSLNRYEFPKRTKPTFKKPRCRFISFMKKDTNWMSLKRLIENFSQCGEKRPLNTIVPHKVRAERWKQAKDRGSSNSLAAII